MTIIEFILVTGTLWGSVVLIELTLLRRRSSVTRRIPITGPFSSFLPSVVIHLALFVAFYGALGYLIVESTPLLKLEITISWVAGGLAAIPSYVEIIHIRTDETWLLRKWIGEDLKETNDPEAHLESLIQNIQSDQEDDSSRRVLIALREISTRGDSMAALVGKVLDKHGFSVSGSTAS